MSKKQNYIKNYTCTDYRAEMTLLRLRKRLKNEEDMSRREREDIVEEIQRLESEMHMD